MNILHGIQNFLQFINDNWTCIVVIIGLLISLYKKIENYLEKSSCTNSFILQESQECVNYNYHKLRDISAKKLFLKMIVIIMNLKIFQYYNLL